MREIPLGHACFSRATDEKKTHHTPLASSCSACIDCMHTNIVQTFDLGLGKYSDFEDHSYPRYNRQSPCVFCYANADPAPLAWISFE
jgi:hypothetical protein